MRYGNEVSASGRRDRLPTLLDVLPTVAKRLGVELPAERKIDGKDLWPLIVGEEGAVSPHEEFYCYYGRELHAVRDRRWKLHFPHPYRTLDGQPGGKGGYPVDYKQTKSGLELYDLQNDVGETKNVAAEHPEIVARLTAAAERARAELGDGLTKREGSGVRPAGKAKQRPAAGG